MSTIDEKAGASTFDVRAFTDAPLRMEGIFNFHAPPSAVWPRVTDPNAIASWFKMITHGDMDHSRSASPGDWGEGSKRMCYTKGMGTLDETIMAYESPHLVAYNVKVWSMPIKDHLAVMRLEETAAGTRFTWQQYFNFKGLVMRHFFPGMMSGMMTRGMEQLQKEFGGPAGEMRII